MIGAAIGAGVKVAGAIAGAIGGAQQMKKARKVLDGQRQDNQTWFDKEYNQDFTQRADTQALLNNVRTQADAQYKRAEQTAAITGATDESLAMQKGNANDMYAETISGINQQADAHKQSIMNRFLDTRSELANAELDTYKQGAQNYQNLAQNAGEAGKGMENISFKK